MVDGVQGSLSGKGQAAEAATLPNDISLSKKESAFGFFDLLDMINPLQHIPLLGTLYRHITGDEIHPVSRIVGGGIFGGPLGAASGLIGAVVEDGTGKEPAELALSLFSEGREDKAVMHSKAAAHYAKANQASMKVAQTVVYNS